MTFQPGDLASAARDALAPLLGKVEVLTGERLPGSERAVVMRAVARDARGHEHPLVLKAPTTSGDGWAREESALRLLESHRVGGVVRLLGTSADPPLLVLADLGEGPTLADRLLGEDPAAAESAVLAWAEAIGNVQARTTGLRQAFNAELTSLSPLGPPASDTSSESVAEAVTNLTRDLPRLGIVTSDSAFEELRSIPIDLDVSAPGSCGGLVPGDTCPSNAIETPDGLVLLDFEGAEYRHLAWEAACLSVPWPSCWCSWRLPPEVATRALSVWRQAVAPTLPAVMSPAFDDDMVRATTAWAFISASWFLGPALDGDPPPTDPARRAMIPTRRALLQHRLSEVAGQETSLLPALRDLAAQTLEATVRLWGSHPLLLAKAFR